MRTLVDLLLVQLQTMVILLVQTYSQLKFLQAKHILMDMKLKNVPTIKDINKARDFETKNADISIFDTGNFSLITNIYGTPDISEVASETTPFKEVQFYDTPTSTRGTANGTLIGVGRARSMQFSAGVAGSSSSNNTSVYRLYLFDLRPFTILTLSGTPSPTLTADHVLTAFK